MGDDFAEITTGAEVKHKEKLGFCLESIIQIHDERMTHVGKYISFSFGVSN